jgi:branched-chain amino acid transport system ATP-binding protein
VRENLQMGGFFADKARLETDLERVFGLFPRLKERGALSAAAPCPAASSRCWPSAAALMGRPSLLLLDEPSLGLAPIIIAQIFQILKEIREEGVTIFLVEQNAHRALQLADRGYVLENGRIVLADTGANLLANDQVRKAYLGG